MKIGPKVSGLAGAWMAAVAALGAGTCWGYPPDASGAASLRFAEATACPTEQSVVGPIEEIPSEDVQRDPRRLARWQRAQDRAEEQTFQAAGCNRSMRIKCGKGRADYVCTVISEDGGAAVPPPPPSH